MWREVGRTQKMLALDTLLAMLVVAQRSLCSLVSLVVTPGHAYADQLGQVLAFLRAVFHKQPRHPTNTDLGTKCPNHAMGTRPSLNKI